MKKKQYIFLLLLLSSSVFAQYPTLLKDINPVGGESPSNYINLNGIVYFTHNDDVQGNEFWRTDGTAAGTYLVKDINLGSDGSYPKSFLVFNNMLYFTAKTNATGYELWKSDGTESGTVLVKDIQVGKNSSEPKTLTNCGNYIIFSADDGTYGREIWKSDGTTAGTQLISDMNVGSAGSIIEEILYAPSFFSANIYFTFQTNPTLINRIYSMNYSYLGAGTLSLPTIINNTQLANSLCWYNFALYFRSTFTLKKYDGSSLTTLKTFDNYSFSKTLTVFNNKLYFEATINASGTEFWMSDGTVAGTVIVKDINAGTASSVPSNFFIGNNLLYFSANDGIHGTELWKTDGTSAGTTLAVDIETGVYSSSPKCIAFDNNLLYYQTTDNQGNFRKLLKYDAISAQNLLIKDFYPVNTFDIKSGGALIGSTLIFNGNDDTNGVEVWKSNGTVAGTTLIKNISQGNSSSFGFKTIGTNTFFAANPNSFRTYPFVTNGTSSGTFKLRTMKPYLFGSKSEPNFTDVNGIVMFSGSGIYDDYELWKTDGTELGTSLIKNINPNTINQESSFPDYLTNANGTLFFSADDGTNGFELWKSDGIEAGTVLVKDINPGPSDSSPRDLIYFNNFVYFMAMDNSNRRGLWRSDGTSVGTTLIKTINPIDLGDNNEFVVFMNKLFFTANDGTNGNELWVSDGTTAGTVLFKDINVGGGSSNPKELTANATKLYFSAENGVNIGRELWVSDGTSVGTSIINIYPDSPGVGVNEGCNPQSLTFVGNTLFFSAESLIPASTYFGRELWRSEGTLANSQMVKDISPTNNSGISDTFTNKFAVIGSNIYFPATNGANGFELWKSNGTAAGTQMVNDLYQGYNDGLYPDASIHANPTTGQVFFEGTNGQNGRELWSFTFCPTSLIINTTVNTSSQKQQASEYLNSSSNIANTNQLLGDVNVLYTAGKSIILEPGFFVKSQFSEFPILPNPRTVFKAEINGCN